MVRPGVAQRLREGLGVRHALRGRVAAADDRERRLVQQLDAALHVEERRRVGDLQQLARIAGIGERDDVVRRIFEPAPRGCQGRRRASPC